MFQTKNVFEPHTTYWYGKPITKLDKAELIEALEWCGKEIQYLQKDRDRWMRAGDSSKYLMDKES